jgi:hypothetical protein
MMHRYSGDKLPSDDGNIDPRVIAEQFLHLDDDAKPVIPGEALLAAIINGGKFHKFGKSKLTTGKTTLVTAFIGIEEMLPRLHDHDPWSVDARRIVNPSTGGARLGYRPRFDKWSCTFTIILYSPAEFGENKARALVDDAGMKIGLLAFRPERRGSFGRFKVTLWKILSDERSASKSRLTKEPAKNGEPIVI